MIQSIIFGALQGITELLPISSTGHLILLGEQIQSDANLLTVTFVHLASAFALLILYAKEIIGLIKNKNKDYFINIIIASIPVMLIGVLIGDYIDSVLYDPIYIALSLVIWGIIMIFVEKKYTTPKKEHLDRKGAGLVGLFQIFALIPGTSRSGSTTVAGVIGGVSKVEALAFTFIMGIMLLFGSSGFVLLKEREVIFEGGGLDMIAFVSAFFFSLMAGYLLKSISKKNFLTFLGVYRIVLGVVVLVI